jgi:hypothetical protein
MNPRTTGILFLIAAALGAFVYFYEIRGEEGRREAEARQKRLFPDIEADAVEWLALTSSDGRQVRAERRERGWQIVEPLVFPGDEFALDGMASALAQVASEAVYEDPQSPEVYGLDDESREVRFAAGGAEHALRTGDKTPMGGNSYASVVGAKPVYAVPSFRVNSLSKAFDDLRDKRILLFDSSAVERLSASWPDGRVELIRQEGEWRLSAPVEGPADADTVKDLLSDLSFLRASGFEDEPPPDAETGLDRPVFAVELELAPAAPVEEGSGEPRLLAFAVGSEVLDAARLVRAAQPSLYRIPAERLDDFPREVMDYRFKQLAEFEVRDAQRIELGFSSQAGETLMITATRHDGAWRSLPEPMAPEKITRLVRAAQPSLYRIPAERLDDFPRQVIDYRFKQLAEFEVSDAERIELGFSLQAGETQVVTLTRHEDAWHSAPEPMAPDKITGLVEALSRLEANDILAERVGPEELRELELDPANVTLLVYGKEEGEQEVRLAEVRLGVLRGSQGIVAQTGENPTLFQLELDLAEHIPVSFEAFRNRFLAEEEEASEEPPIDESP